MLEDNQPAQIPWRRRFKDRLQQILAWQGRHIYTITTHTLMEAQQAAQTMSASMVTSTPNHHISKLPNLHPPQSVHPTSSTAIKHIPHIQLPPPPCPLTSPMASITPCPIMPFQPPLPSPPQSPKLKSHRHLLRRSTASSAISPKPSAPNLSSSMTQSAKPACVSKSISNP